MGFWAIAVIASFLCACSSPEWRINRNKDKFYSYPAQTQAKIRSGDIAEGFTEDMVTMALGNPDRSYIRKTEQEKYSVWAYIKKKPRMDWNYNAGTRQRTVYGSDIRLGAGGGDREHKDEKIRVLFQEGRVVSVETP